MPYLLIPFYCSETVATSQKAALESQAKQMKELEDTISTLKTDLQRAKSSLSNEPKLKEKVSELEGCVDSIKQQNTQLQVRRFESTSFRISLST